jgi:hypothetical protein
MLQLLLFRFFLLGLTFEPFKELGVCHSEVTLIDIVTHAFKIFRTPNIVLKDTHVTERLGHELVLLVEPIDTTCEQHVDDLVTRVEHVILGD